MECNCCEVEKPDVVYHKEIGEFWCSDCFQEFYVMAMAESMDEQETMSELRYWSLI